MVARHGINIPNGNSEEASILNEKYKYDFDNQKMFLDNQTVKFYSQNFRQPWNDVFFSDLTRLYQVTFDNQCAVNIFFRICLAFGKRNE